MSTESAPAVVIGAGPAGLTAAVELAAAGLPVILIDAGERPGGQYWRHSGSTADVGVSLPEPVEGQAGSMEYVGGSFPEPVEGQARPSRKAARGVRSGRPFDRLRERTPSRRLSAVGGPVFRRLDQLRRDGLIDYRPGREVWLITAEAAGHRVELRPTAALRAGERESVLAERLVLCPGGQDRQLPVPGWDLPGVMAAGGMQALLKGQHTLAGRRVVLAGTGPFLLPVATGLAGAGAEVVAVCEANAPSGWLRSAGAVAAAAPSKIIEGAGYAAKLIRHRIPYRSRTIIGEIRGPDRVESVRLDRVDRTGRVTEAGIAELAVDAVGLGWGFTPALELIMMVGAGTELGPDGSLITSIDEGQRSTVPGVYVAGEACGVGGAALAVAEGELVARTLLDDAGNATFLPADRLRERRPGYVDRGHECPAHQSTARLRRRIRRQRSFAAAMHLAHPVPTHWPDWCTAETLICRCEEITVGTATHAAAELGAASARDQKLLTRCGMGWCQGRSCGPAVAGLAARQAGREVIADDLRAMSKRTFAIPVPLSELARLSDPVEQEG